MNYPGYLLDMDTAKKTQLDKFKETARQLETDDDDKRFEERLKTLVKPPKDGAKSEK